MKNTLIFPNTGTPFTWGFWGSCNLYTILHTCMLRGEKPVFWNIIYSYHYLVRIFLKNVDNSRPPKLQYKKKTTTGDHSKWLWCWNICKSNLWIKRKGRTRKNSYLKTTSCIL